MTTKSRHFDHFLIFFILIFTPLTINNSELSVEQLSPVLLGLCRLVI